MSITTQRRRWLATAAAALIGLTAISVGATPAWAGSGYIYGGPSANSYGYYVFDYAVPIGSGQDYLRLLSQPQAMASGKCFDMILDWSYGGHFDPRLARSCKSVTQRDSAVSHESYNVSAPQRLGTCYGTNQATNGAGSVCTFTIGERPGS